MNVFLPTNAAARGHLQAWLAAVQHVRLPIASTKKTESGVECIRALKVLTVALLLQVGQTSFLTALPTMVFEVAKAWTQTFYDPEIVLRNLSFYHSVALHCDAQISAEDTILLGLHTIRSFFFWKPTPIHDAQPLSLLPPPGSLPLSFTPL